MSGAEWITIVQLITGAITAIAAPFVGYWIWVVQEKMKETKEEVLITKEKVNENLERLDGRLTQLLELTRREARAEAKAEALAEAAEIAKDVLKAKAETDAKVLAVAQEQVAKSEKDRNTE